MSVSMPLDDAAESFLRLAELLYRTDTFAEVYDAVGRAAVDLVPGCDHACITTVRGGQSPELQTATDEVAARIDRLEWESGEGPCVDAILSQRFEWDPDITQAPSWPALAARVLEETPVRGMIGYRILVGDRKAGALNLFSDEAGGFTKEAADTGAILAAFATVALSAATQKDEARTLREGLASNREIGKALGLLMATHGVDDAAAFALLREASTSLNRRLATIAQQVVERHNEEYA